MTLDNEETPDSAERCHCQENQKNFLTRAFDHLGLDDSQRALLLNSFREVSVQVPLRVERSGRLVVETFTIISRGIVTKWRALQ